MTTTPNQRATFRRLAKAQRSVRLTVLALMVSIGVVVACVHLDQTLVYSYFGPMIGGGLIFSLALLPIGAGCFVALMRALGHGKSECIFILLLMTFLFPTIPLWLLGYDRRASQELRRGGYEVGFGGAYLPQVRPGTPSAP